VALLQTIMGINRAFLEQRRSLRENVRFPAWIDLGDGALHDCTVLDVSENGARIMIAKPAKLPDELHLVLSGNGTRRRCRLAWRSDEEAGLQYLGPLDRKSGESLL
jgi:PilZ domain